MRDRNGKDIAVGQRAVVLAGPCEGLSVTVDEIQDEHPLGGPGVRVYRTEWLRPSEIAVVDDAAGEGKA